MGVLMTTTLARICSHGLITHINQPAARAAKALHFRTFVPQLCSEGLKSLEGRTRLFGTSTNKPRPILHAIRSYRGEVYTLEMLGPDRIYTQGVVQPHTLSVLSRINIPKGALINSDDLATILNALWNTEGNTEVSLRLRYPSGKADTVGVPETDPIISRCSTAADLAIVSSHLSDLTRSYIIDVPLNEEMLQSLVLVITLFNQNRDLFLDIRRPHC